MTEKPKTKGPNILGAFMDFLILVLLVGGAGFGGYYWGTTQRIAPVNLVPAGTPGAQPATISTTSTTTAGPGNKTIDMGHSSTSTSTATSTPATTTATSTPTTATPVADTASTTETPAPAKVKHKFWVASFGTDYIGSQITVKVNGKAVDSFFGPDKTVDITKHVKSGDNTVTFEAKAMGDSYNNHKGDASSELILKLVAGPKVTEDFNPADVITTFKRSATDDEDEKESKHFVK